MTSAPALMPASAPHVVSPDAPAEEFQHVVALPTGPVTLNLRRVALRTEGFGVRVQQEDGSFRSATAEEMGSDLSYLGTVEGHPEAYASAQIMNDGEIWTQIVFDQNLTYWMDGDELLKGGGEPFVMPRPDQPFKWPKNDILPLASAPSGAPLAYDFAVDTTSDYFESPEGANGDVARVVSLVAYAQNNLRATYLQQIGVATLLEEVVVRPFADVDPYDGEESTLTLLGNVSALWGSCGGDGKLCEQSGADAYQLVTPGALNGRAFRPGVASVSTASSRGWFDGVARHEIAHNWGVLDYHADSPEGPTIESGNAVPRWDATEVNTLFATRKEWIRNGKLRESEPAPILFPANAVTDYVERPNSAAATVTEPLSANDFSVNQDRLNVVSVDPVSAAGVPVSLLADGRAEYAPGDRVVPDGIDYFRYRVETAAGQWTTGLVLVKNGEHRLTVEAEDAEPIGGATVRNVGEGLRRIFSGDATVELGDGNGIRFEFEQAASRTTEIGIAYWAYPVGTSFRVMLDGQELLSTGALPGNGLDVDPRVLYIPDVFLSSGVHEVVVEQTNGVDVDIDYLTVRSPNSPPTVPDSQLAGAVESVPYETSLVGLVSDPDAPSDSYTFEMASGPEWLRIDPSGVLRGTPAPESAGVATITIEARDAFGYPTTFVVGLDVADGASIPVPEVEPPEDGGQVGGGGTNQGIGVAVGRPSSDALAATGVDSSWIGFLALGTLLLAGGGVALWRRRSATAATPDADEES